MIVPSKQQLHQVKGSIQEIKNIVPRQCQGMCMGNCNIQIVKKDLHGIKPIFLKK